MRVSTDENDPGYTGAIHGCRITLDGESVERRCITADDSEGFALLAVYDEYGAIAVEDGRIVTEEVRGQVVITLPDGWMH